MELVFHKGFKTCAGYRYGYDFHDPCQTRTRKMGLTGLERSFNHSHQMINDACMRPPSLTVTRILHQMTPNTPPQPTLCLNDPPCSVKSRNPDNSHDTRLSYYSRRRTLPHQLHDMLSAVSWRVRHWMVVTHLHHPRLWPAAHHQDPAIWCQLHHAGMLFLAMADDPMVTLMMTQLYILPHYSSHLW